MTARVGLRCVLGGAGWGGKGRDEKVPPCGCAMGAPTCAGCRRRDSNPRLPRCRRRAGRRARPAPVSRDAGAGSGAGGGAGGARSVSPGGSGPPPSFSPPPAPPPPPWAPAAPSRGGCGRSPPRRRAAAAPRAPAGSRPWPGREPRAPPPPSCSHGAGERGAALEGRGALLPGRPQHRRGGREKPPAAPSRQRVVAAAPQGSGDRPAPAPSGRREPAGPAGSHPSASPLLSAGPCITMRTGILLTSSTRRQSSPRTGGSAPS